LLIIVRNARHQKSALLFYVRNATYFTYKYYKVRRSEVILLHRCFSCS